MLLESYILWKDKTLTESYVIQSEEHFYLCFGFVLIGIIILFWDKYLVNDICSILLAEKLLFLLLLRIWTQILYYGNMTERKSNEQLLSMQILKSLTLASIAKFLLLPIMIWNNNTNETGILIHLALVTGYYGLCLINVYSGTFFFAISFI